MPHHKHPTNTADCLRLKVCVAQVFSLGVCLFELFSKIILAADIAYDGSPAEFERYSMNVRDYGTRILHSLTSPVMYTMLELCRARVQVCVCVYPGRCTQIIASKQCRYDTHKSQNVTCQHVYVTTHMFSSGFSDCRLRLGGQVAKGYRRPHPRHWLEGLSALVDACMAQEPEDRHSAAQVCPELPCYHQVSRRSSYIKCHNSSVINLMKARRNLACAANNESCLWYILQSISTVVLLAGD